MHLIYEIELQSGFSVTHNMCWLFDNKLHVPPLYPEGHCFSKLKYFHYF